MMGPATGCFTENNGEKYLIIDTIDKYEEVFSGIKSEIEKLMVEKRCITKNIMRRLELIQMIIYL